MTGVVGSAAAKLCAQRHGYWIDGPTGEQKELKTWTIDLPDFLELVWKVEKAASGPAEAAQWLRRLYYSGPLKGAGPKFDKVLNTDPSRLASVRDVPQSILDLLVRVKDVRISWEQRPENQQVDISHVLVLLDYRLNGPGTWGRALNTSKRENNVESMLNWAADLGSVWLGFNKIRSANKPDETLPFSSVAKIWLESAISARASRSDLLGDLDAMVLAREALPKSKTPISDLLATYYQPGHSTAIESRVAERFALFCTRTSPAIPHTVTGSGGVDLSPDAMAKIKDLIEEAAFLLFALHEGVEIYNVTVETLGKGTLGSISSSYKELIDYFSSPWLNKLC